LAELGLVGDSRNFENILAFFLLRLRLNELVFGFWVLKLSKLLSCTICSLFDTIAFIESVLATRDSSSELGMETIGARPARSDMGVAMKGERESRIMPVLASIGAAGNGEAPANGSSNIGVSLIRRRLRVLRRS
jgi:hypothetical protein